MILCGSAGTGKTLLGIYKGMAALQDEEVDRVIIVRSVVATRDVGYLPGSLDDKVEVFEQPYKEIFSFLYDDASSYRLWKNKQKAVQFMTSSFLRGITLEDSYIIVDEFQNMSFHELDSIMTRLGDNCKVIFCGDIKQSDLPNSGLEKFLRVIRKMKDHFSIVEFEVDDIVRSGIVKDYLVTKQNVLNE